MAGELDQTENAVHPAITAVVNMYNRGGYGSHTP